MGKDNNIYEPELVIGDFLKEYKNHIDKKSVDLVLTDMPYGIFTDNKDITGVEDPKINILELNDVLDYILKDNGYFLTFCNLKLMIELMKGLEGFQFHYEYVCFKNNGMPAGPTHPIHNIEYVAAFYKNSAKPTDLTFNPRETGIVKDPYVKPNKNRNHSTRKMKKRKCDTNKTGKRFIKQSIQMNSKCNLPKEERTPHTLQKPEKVLRRFIRIHSKEGDLVCDGFVGSGSTLVAAYKEKRRSIGFEIDKRWYDVAEDRIESVIENRSE
jgi:site-specific DNA-methyltransferase (adenine-specific)